MDGGYVILVALAVSASLFFSGMVCMFLHQKHSWGLFREQWPSFQDSMVDLAFKPRETFKVLLGTLAYSNNDSEELTQRKKCARKYLFLSLAFCSSAFLPMLVLVVLVSFGWMKLN